MNAVPAHREIHHPSPTCETAAIVDGVEIIPWIGLDSDARRRWQSLRATQREFATPFFSLAFFDAVQASRGDVWVAVMRDHSEIVALLPFHRIDGVAWPVGRYFNDAHNVVMHPQTQLDWSWLLRECEVKAFDFHALVGSHRNIHQCAFQGSIESFSADLGNDPTAFLCGLERSHATIRKQDQKTRKMSRELGPLRVEVDCRDPSVLAHIIQLKRDQYQRTHILDLFTPQWTRDLMGQLHRGRETSTRDDSMRGLLSVLRAGDTIVAGHYGMIEDGLLHYWFPTYDIRYARFSPGTALFKEVLRVAGDHSIRCIDMGYGEQPYKRKQTATVTAVKYGCVTSSAVYRRWRAIRSAAAQAAKQLPLKGSLKQMLRRLQPNAGISKIR